LRGLFEIDPLKVFYPAEHDHQSYATRHPDHRYIIFDAAPIAHLHQLFPDLYRGQ
jgi:peptide methionine sulfoxide reductase MsrA